MLGIAFMLGMMYSDFFHCRFSEAQNRILLSYYNAGMRGIGKQYTHLLSAACDESGLSKEQVVVCKDIH